jgi:hypothetical protein
LITEPAKLPSVSLETYIVGFFDLLGQQERLRGLTQVPDKNDAEAMAAASEIVTHTYGAVHAMRGWFRDSFETYSRKPLDASGLNEEGQKLYAQLNSNEIELRGVSDSMIVSASLRKHENTQLPVRAVMGVIMGAGLVSTGCMMMGHPIRGGIDLGVGFKTPEGEIYGPALSRAYTLESEIAGYPRVVVGKELLAWLSYQVTNPTPDIFGEYTTKWAQACGQCLALDHDGHAFVDYLGPYFRELLDTSAPASFVHEAHGHVIRLCGEFKRAGNSKLAFRYRLLRDYYENRIRLWTPPRDAV